MKALTSLVVLSVIGGCVTADDGDSEEETIVDGGGKGDGASVPSLGPRFDRIGRPELTNITLAAPSFDKAAYNREDPFALSDRRATYAAIGAGTIGRYDTFDGIDDMTDAQVAYLVDVLLDDHLRIDLSKPCGELDSETYLDIERAEAYGLSWATCGGRSPNADVIDHVLTLVTGGLEATQQVHDGISTWDDRSPAQKRVFPYLAEAF